MLIAIDFDGTLVNRKGIPTSSNVWLDKPNKGAIETLKLLWEKKIMFYIFTNRGPEQWHFIKAWLVRNGFEGSQTGDVPYITNIQQPNTTIYLDDRAVRFTSWNNFRKLIL